MANIQSSKKRIRKTLKYTECNISRRSRIRTLLKVVENAIISNQYLSAKEALRIAQSELMRGVVKGIYKKRTASRKISRFNTKIKMMKI